MINALVKTLQIDLNYSVNSFIYILSRLPILKDLITNDAYKSKFIKTIVGIIAVILSSIRALALKFACFFVILYVSTK